MQSEFYMCLLCDDILLWYINWGEIMGSWLNWKTKKRKTNTKGDYKSTMNECMKWLQVSKKPALFWKLSNFQLFIFFPITYHSLWSMLYFTVIPSKCIQSPTGYAYIAFILVSNLLIFIYYRQNITSNTGKSCSMATLDPICHWTYNHPQSLCSPWCWFFKPRSKAFRCRLSKSTTCDRLYVQLI